LLVMTMAFINIIYIYKLAQLKPHLCFEGQGLGS
jgi:hypothetical protein